MSATNVGLMSPSTFGGVSYGDVQATRPLTLAYGLSDSPAGLAAWIVEKFSEWAAARSAACRAGG